MLRERSSSARRVVGSVICGVPRAPMDTVRDGMRFQVADEGRRDRCRVRDRLDRKIRVPRPSVTRQPAELQRGRVVVENALGVDAGRINGNRELREQAVGGRGMRGSAFRLIVSAPFDRLCPRSTARARRIKDNAFRGRYGCFKDLFYGWRHSREHLIQRIHDSASLFRSARAPGRRRKQLYDLRRNFQRCCWGGRACSGHQQENEERSRLAVRRFGTKRSVRRGARERGERLLQALRCVREEWRRLRRDQWLQKSTKATRARKVSVTVLRAMTVLILEKDQTRLLEYAFLAGERTVRGTDVFEEKVWLNDSCWQADAWPGFSSSWRLSPTRALTAMLEMATQHVRADSAGGL